MTIKVIAPCSGQADTARECSIAAAMNIPKIAFKTAAENPESSGLAEKGGVQ